jgi:DNA-binding CsgD family transcriptional regulator
LTELEVLRLLAKRLTNAEIATELFLSQKTIRKYGSGILAKLQVADRAEARLIARAAGLGDAESRGDRAAREQQTSGLGFARPSGIESRTRGYASAGSAAGWLGRMFWLSRNRLAES